MWCRAILAAVVLTYIICVLIINGLQKEDLDVNTLKKLQRHNVNIDDVNNETLSEECAKSAGGSSKQLIGEGNPATLSSKNEEPKIKLSESNLQNVIINYFNNAQKSSKTNEGKTVKVTDTKPSTDTANIEHFMDMWNVLSKTIKDNVSATTKAFESTSTAVTQSTAKYNIRASDNKSMEYINTVLLRFIASQQTTTNRPTTEKVDYEFIAQKLKEILANNNKNMQDPSTTVTTAYEVGKSIDGKINEALTIKQDSTLYKDEIRKLTNQLKVFGPLNDKNSSSTNVHFEDKNVQYEAKRQNLVENTVPTKILAFNPNENLETRKPSLHMNKQINVLSEDIIRELSENVRAKVLQDLKRVITTTNEEPTSNIEFTTVKTTSTTQKTTKKKTTIKPNKTQGKDVTKFMEEFMEMFQQFKSNGESTKPPKNAKVPRGKNISEKHTQAELRYQSYNVPVNIPSVFISPYNPEPGDPILQSALPNKYALLNINTPLQNIDDAQPVAKITQLNIFNTKNSYQTPPITIQTNAVEVPPLGLRAPDSVKVVYQNIVVTTMHPPQKLRYSFEKKHSSNKNKNDNNHSINKAIDESLHGTNKKYNEPRTQERYNQRGRDIRYRERHDRNREYINDPNYQRKPIEYEDHGRAHYKDHSIERFHEKLERVDGWPRISRERNDEEYETAKLVSRHQLPLNDAKKRQRNDNTHFRNFIKTQQKVNDMLERILAAKKMDVPRSLETTVS